jgi:hypothetical protein
MSVGAAGKNGEANMPWYRCKVNEVGPAGDGTETPAPVVYINVTDTGGAFANTWFYAANGIKQQLLDVGIAAIINCQYVEVAATAPAAGNNPFTEVSRAYGLPPQPPKPPTDFHQISLTPPAENSDSAVLVVGWNEDNSSYVGSFEIQEQWDAPGGPSQGQVSYVPGANSRTTALSLEAGRTYYLFVRANNLAGSSGESNTITLTIPSSTPTPPPPTTASLTAVARIGYPQNQSGYGLYIEGNDFSANEMVEVTVVWKVAGEAVSYLVEQQNGQNPQANLAGYFSVWWGPDSNGLCPYSEPVGTSQPLQQFSVTATGVTSGRTGSKTTTLICP